ncbi:WXG100 family type VII secretion target [Nocardia abscessus]|uniref:WXG100 family type VII secretion target n=1 Tax=Nocardia abscessus TaxID=120957 RepID=UPI001894BA34|nr:WXG100 family type VII secretion target [Nocardia abscessus]MBF6221105.1 WXG100 family type VII secretion target [Nocardia abscessus]
MSDELQVEVDRLRDASRFIADKAQLVRDRVAQLDNTIGKELLADGWRGSAASAYDESWIEWKQGADDIVAALETSAANLADAANRYEFRDTTNRDAITQLGNQL